jgi:hypothetical protein
MVTWKHAWVGAARSSAQESKFFAGFSPGAGAVLSVEFHITKAQRITFSVAFGQVKMPVGLYAFSICCPWRHWHRHFSYSQVSSLKVDGDKAVVKEEFEFEGDPALPLPAPSLN